jgi:N-acetyl-gamma-glutamyl-phosphate reductase
LGRKLGRTGRQLENEMVRVGVLGATGYTGYELFRLLGRHPWVAVVFATSQSHAGRRLSDLYPAGPDISLVAPDSAPLDTADLLFLCLPHATAAPVAAAALAQGQRVVDLSADFRLREPAVYAHWYGLDHPAPALLKEAVYGLTEFARAALPAARLVANPGCYPTAILLALQPALVAGAIGGPIIADAKSGVSGAGREPKQSSHFVEVNENFSPYKIGRSHRHLPEMEQALAAWQPAAPPLIFSPHLLPVSRGILATIYAPLQAGWTEADVRALYAERYGGEPFVRLLPAGQPATLAHAVRTNRCAIGLVVVAGTLILTSAIDNLVKGAAGQAIQNMNVMFGLEETAGLL